MAEKYISGEKHREMLVSNPVKRPMPMPLIFGLIGLALVLLSFYCGVIYQKTHQSKASSALSYRNGGMGNGFPGGGSFGHQRPTAGQVTAVSADSITVQDSASGSNITLDITSATQISNNGQSVAATTIQVGDTVLVRASASDKTKASRIIVNPSFGGPPAATGNGTSTSGSGTTPALTN